MGAVLLRARAEIRSRWRTWVWIGVLVGLTGGASIAAIAGARRTESSYPRFLRAQKAVDVIADVRDKAGRPAPIEDVRAFSVVEDASTALALFGSQIEVGGRRMQFPDVYVIVSRDGRFGTEINVSKILRGRRPDPTKYDEVIVGFTVAERFGIDLGDELAMRVLAPGPGGAAPTGEVTAEMTLRVVGIGGMPGEFQTLAGASLPSILLTPAFFKRFESSLSADEAFGIRFRNGTADLPAFEREAGARGYRTQAFFQQRIQTASVRRSMSFQAFALWLLGGLTAFAAFAILGQALARQAALESDEYPTLRALGMAPGSLIAVGLIRSTVVSVVGATLAAVIATVVSPLAPVGLARLAEPDPGIAIDMTVLGLGMTAIVLFVTGSSGLAQWRVGRRLSFGSTRARRQSPPSGVAEAMARSGFPAPVVAGVRLALGSGRGDAAVPVRSTVLGVALGVLAMASALTFSAGMGHLVATPELTGWTFDLLAGGAPDSLAAFEKALRDEGMFGSGVDAATPGLLIQDKEIIDAAIAFGPGEIGPAIAEGRAPATADEVALGRDTMDRSRLRIGGTAKIAGLAGMDAEPRTTAPKSFRIVGRLIQPSLGFNLGSAGQGAAMTIEGVERFGDRALFEQSRGIFVRLRRGFDLRDVAERIAPRFPGLFVIARSESRAAADVGGLSGMPLLLAAILALMALGTMGHTLLTSIRRRARDLAILRTVGFVGAQVRSTVAWQATVLTIAGTIVGLPLGVIAGRWGWLAFAETLGVLPVAIAPTLALVLVVPVVLVLANIIALVPARSAARTQPALVLRNE